ncbi:MAG: glycerol dehydrogenase [Desulfarculales bacterium]|nr:glycerol dehydrogenase [Desulfarculales bacterium]
MAVIIKAPSKYIQGQGELANLGLHAKKLGSKFFLLASANTRNRIGEAFTQSLAKENKEFVFCAFGGQCSKAEIARVMEECSRAGGDVIVGAGGGKVIDTAKAAADNLNLPVIIVPTVASNDAPCSGIAVIYNDEGIVVKAQFTQRDPDLVLVDTEIIAKAPARLFSAGLGDALATWFEARAAHASGARSMARGQCSNTALKMARLCYDLLLSDGVQALEDVKKGQCSQALENAVEASIFLSGLGFESGGLAAAHAVNDGLAHLPQTKGMYHGEKVAFGVLVQLALEKAPQDELKQVMGFMKATGLPMTLAQLGIAGAPAEEDIRKVAEAACVPTQSTKNLPFPVSLDDVYKAILEADRLGRQYN